MPFVSIAGSTRLALAIAASVVFVDLVSAQPRPPANLPSDAAWSESLERVNSWPAPPTGLDSGFYGPVPQVARQNDPRLPPPIVIDQPSPSDLPTGPPRASDIQPIPSVLQSARTPAQPQASAGWSLAALESLALERSPAIGEASARVEAARGRWVQAGLPPNLVIGYAGTEIGNEGRAGQQGLYLAQEFVRGGKLSLAQQVAAQEWRQATCELEAMRWRVLTDVRRAFYTYRIAVRRHDVGQELIEISGRSAELTQKLVDSGELRGVEALQTETDLARAEVNRARFAVAVESRQRALEAVVAASLPSGVAIDGELTAPPAISWNETLSRIETESPLMTAALAAVDRASWAVQYERAQVIPNVEAQAMMQHDYATDSAIAGLQLAGPIPIWNQNQGNIRRAEAEVREARQSVERLRRSLAHSLSADYREYESSRILVERYERDVLPKVARTIDLARQALAAREASFLELLTAQRTYFQTTLEYLDSLETMWVAYARIDGFLLDGSLDER